LFAELFSYPGEGGYVRLCGGEVFRELDAAIAELPFDLDVETALADSFPGRGNCRQEYSDLFDLTGGLPRVSLLERRYRDDSDQELWEKLLRFYSYFHLDFSKGTSTEQLDHITTELSFMHYLTFFQARKTPDFESLEKGQCNFLENHLSVFAAGIETKLDNEKSSALYPEIGRWLARFVLSDHAYLQTRIKAG
jgi:DMSO reductase family type II enzyme chaperone